MRPEPRLFITTDIFKCSMNLLPAYFLLLGVFFFTNPLQAQQTVYTLEKADSLFRQYQLFPSERAYLIIARDSANEVAIRTKAYLQLASLRWRFNQQYDRAMEALHSAATLKGDPYVINLLRASINLEAAHYDLAYASAEISLNAARGDPEKMNAGLLFAQVIQKQNFERAVTGDSLNKPDLIKAKDILDAILEKQPGNPECSDALMGTGILLKDGASVLKGWKSYYLVSNEQNINLAIRPGFEWLKPVLDKWNNNSLTASALKALAIGFAHSRFFEYAAFFASEVKKGKPEMFRQSPQLQDILAYQEYMNGIQKVNNQIYPQVARGLTKYEDAYDSLIRNADSVLWSTLSFIPRNQKFDPDSLYNILKRKFGLEGYTGITVNYYGMLKGHIIHRELKDINQYGYRTTFTYISVDRLISRDFTSWYGTTNVGGWGDSTTIIQVRKAYMTEPFQELIWMTDPAEHTRMKTLIAKKKQNDRETCMRDPYAEPTFLSPYIKFTEASKIYKHLNDSGLRGMELNIAFVDKILELTIASTVFAHEGRHAIDQRYLPKEFAAMSDDERELRAKFSEVVFSLNPRMAFTGSILGSDLDENTNHGKANKRFRVVIVNWMNAHKSEITGLDKKVPLLMQFDLLTDAQLIAICKSADPMANRS